jgi:O-antigen/teichoic acid export membrane protein
LSSTGEQASEAEAAASIEGDVSAGRSTRRALSLSLRTTFLGQFLMAVSGVMLARALGQEDRGEIAAAMLWPTVIAGLGTLGLTESLTFHIAKEPDRAGRFIGSGLVLASIQAVFFSALTAALIPLVLSNHESEVVTAGLIYSAYLPLITFGVVFIGALNGMHRYRAFNAVRLSIFVLMVASQAVLLAFDSSTVRAIVIAFVGCQAAMTVLAAVLLRRAKPGPLAADRGTMRQLFGYGVRSNTGTSSSFLNQRLDQLTISAFMSASQLGLYAVAVNLTQVSALVGNAVAYATLPNVASLEPGPERTQLARRLVGFTLVLATALALPVILLAPLMIEILFGSEFSEAADISRVLAAGAIVFAVARAVEALLRAVGRPLAAGMGELMALGATIAGLAVMLPLFGVIGAAAVSVLARGVSCAWMSHRVAPELGTTPLRLLTPPRSIFTTLAEELRKRFGRSKADSDAG